VFATPVILFSTLFIHTADGLAKPRKGPEAQRTLTESQDVKPAASQDATALQLGKTVTREIKGGATHSFKVSLNAGQYVRLLVEQHGIILLVTLRDLNDKQIVEMDNPSGGHGPIYLSAIAPAAGDYRLGIRSSEDWANPGQYELSIEDLRQPTPADRDQVAAGDAFAEGRRLADKNTRDSRLAAIKKYEQALAYWKGVGDRHSEALTLFSMARTYRRLGQNQTASEFFEKIMPLQLDEHDWRLLASSLNDRGLNLFDLGERQMALESLNKAFTLYRDHQDRRGQASVFNNIGLAYHKMGALREAIENYEKAIPLRQAENDQVGEFNVRNNIGGVYDVSGEPLKALERYRETLKVLQEWDKLGQLKDRDRLGIGFNNVAEAQNKLGEWEQARDGYEQALSIFQTTGNSQREAACLDNIGQLHQDLGDPALALEYFKKALDLLHEKVKDPDAEANVLSHIGSANLSQGNLSEALQDFQTAFALPQSPRGQGYELTNVGAVYFQQNNPQKALEFYGKALLLLKSVGDQQGQAVTLYKRGEAYGLLHNQSQALQDFSGALSIWKSIANRRGEATTLLGIAHLQADLNNLDEAVKHNEAALAIIESLRTNISSSRLRASYFATQQNYYELDIELNMRLYQQDHATQHLAVALQASEGSRARSIIDTLNGARVDITEGVSEDLLTRAHEIQQRLTAKSEAQTKLLSSKHSAPQADTIANEIIGLITEDRDVRDRIRINSPKYSHLTQPQPSTLPEIQQQLGKDTLLLEYALGDKRSYVWVVSQDSINGFELPARDQIEAIAGRVTEALTARNREEKNESFPQRQLRIDRAEKDYAETSAALSKMILGPVGSLLGNKRLVVVADGALQLVPFAALPAPADSAIAENQSVKRNSSSVVAANATPLISEHEIITLPSASVLALQRRELANRKPAPLAVAVIADPVFDLQDERVARATGNGNQHRKDVAASGPAGTALYKPGAQRSPATPGPLNKPSVLSTALRDVGLDPDGRMPRLALSRAEAMAIARAAPANQSLSALDFRASRETATSSELSKYRIIHFATHGVLDLEHPELSGIVLSMVDEKGQPQDGYLRLHEIYNLNLPAELVVLSACQTGIGKQVKGEGLIALTRGFMYAGAARVVASLWKVDDAATAELMGEFYKQMFTNKLKPAAALRAAQIKMSSQQKRWQSPYYWAGFFLQGEWN
jgi:CHAT domain-containing protein/tetratricopeptide (TPR) repeat protein